MHFGKRNRIIVTAIAWCLVGAGWGVDVPGAVMTVSSDSANRLISSSFANTNFTDFFSTFANFPAQDGLTTTSNATFLSALQTVLGPSAGYQINSAKLTVGSNADDYKSTGTARLLLVSYNSAQVTYNNRATGTPWAAPGGQAGVDFSSTAVSTGVIVGNATDFNGLGPIVQSWINGTTPNFGLYFPSDTDQFTATSNLVWTIDAVVPEPASISLFVLAGLLVNRAACRRRNGC